VLWGAKPHVALQCTFTCMSVYLSICELAQQLFTSIALLLSLHNVKLVVNGKCGVDAPGDR